MSAEQTKDPVAEQIRSVLDGRWEAIRQHLRADPRFPVAEPDLRLDLEAHRARTLELVTALTDSELVRATLPVDLGGTGDVGASVTGLEMIGHGDLSVFVKAGVQFGLFGGAIANLGTERHHREYLPGMADLSLPGCFAMTETGHGSDVQSILTTATYDPATDELVVHSPSPAARKDYIGGAARDARLAAVFAQLVVGEEQHGVHCVLVPLRDESGRPMPGVTIGDCGTKLGLKGVDNGRLMFDQVRVPRANLLNRYGDIDDQGHYSSPIESVNRRFFTMLGTLVRGRVTVAAGAGAATRSALTLAVRYGLQRTQFTYPDGEHEVVVMDYRAHQRKLLPRLAKSYALALAQNAMTGKLADISTGEITDESSQRELEARAAGLKAITTEHANDTIQACREACGGAGYMALNRFADLKADTDVFATFEGDNTVLLQLLAKGMLTDYKSDFQELDTRGAILFGARQVTTSVIEHTIGGSIIQRLISGAPGKDGDNALEDRGGQLAVFEDRESHLTETLAMRLRRAGEEGADSFRVFNEAQDHLLESARAHIDRIALEAFVTAIEEAPDGPGRDLLNLVCDLFVFSTVEANRAWFIEHGRLSASQSKAVVARVNELCGELRPHAATLVSGFGIPDAWLTTEMMSDLASF
ncbi:acyl-CoA dehydrogenase family protein [Janibacter hoylei]|uniref:acyl-CoA dehydrogenase family protein n=1 Tax=Janibacter hoylei TaxID=364298 RepID=UPI0021A8AC01|nr:acyl-CoA dehydrogenase [Janibacter hoylei]MCT1617649.1 acyl-CoA dehydrogenase family protein [Janibacter hoylei]